MLENPFPNGLLVAFKSSFGRYLSSFSVRMNTRITWLTTQWLMGPSKVIDLKKSDGSVAADMTFILSRAGF